MVSEPTDTGREAVAGDVKPRYLIRKYGGFYRPNSQGYTGSAIQAGRYTLGEAEVITHPNGPDGPRDGMSFIHEDDLRDENWEAYAALLARAEAADARVAELESALPRAWEMGRDDAAVCAETVTTTQHVAHSIKTGVFPEQTDMRDVVADAIRALTPPADLVGKAINWRDDPSAIVEDDEPQIGRDYE